MKSIIAAIACLALLLAGAFPEPPLAWAGETQPYRVEYRDPFSPLTENGSDFFAHMQPFRPGQTQSGQFTCANSSQQAVMMEVRLVPAQNRLGQHLSTVIANDEGAAVGHVSPAHPEAVTLCLLQPGQEETFCFEATLEVDTPAELAAETGAVRWEFFASAQQGGPAHDAPVSGDDGGDPGPEGRPGSAEGTPGPLPLTGDGFGAIAALALAALAPCGALALAARGNRRS